MATRHPGNKNAQTAARLVSNAAITPLKSVRRRDAKKGNKALTLRSKRLLRCPGHPLRGHRADDEAPDQPGASRGGNAVEFVDANPGLVERAADQLFEMIEMGPRGDLRHDTAIRLVLGQLCADQIGADVRLRGVANDRRGGLVTAGFNAEDDHQTQMARRRLAHKQARAPRRAETSTVCP